MNRNALRASRFGRLAGLVGIVAAIALVSVPAAGTTTSNRLFAYVRVTNPGPLPPCAQDGSTCTGVNRTDWFVYVVNANRLSDLTGRGFSRATLPNSYVVDKVEVRIFVDGVEFGAPFTTTPPPDAFFRSWSGHWPSTVPCPGTGPCNVVGKPAIAPGEITAAVYGGWVHGDAEPKGTYVFDVTVYGTLEGTPVQLRARSQPIEMT
jgi:hypothetical protein